MLYYYLKIFHIVSAAAFVTSLAMSFKQWLQLDNPDETFTISSNIQSHTIFFIIPFALIQLATGFSLISIKHYSFSETWIVGSVFAFIILMGSWLSFIYFLLLSQQVTVKLQKNPDQLNNRYYFFRRLQSFMLFICLTALIIMIFLMTNKTHS